MHKIVLIPLDERPCNYKFPSLLPMEDVLLLEPNIDILGKKKTPGNFDKLREFMLKECLDAEYLILSMDQLIYGGIVPSRLHFLDEKTIQERIDLLKEIKNKNPGLKIFANQLIMRCPCYSDDDEEPSYFATHGLDIFHYGQLLDVESRGDFSHIDKKNEILKRIPLSAIEDFTQRRALNIASLFHSLDLFREGIIDFFVIPQDDSNKYGFPQMDQRKILDYLKQYHLVDGVLMYPGADEVGLTLLSRALNHIHDYHPRIYLKYASENGRFCVPFFEDRIVGETIKSHIQTSDSIIVECIEDADFILGINVGSGACEYQDQNYYEYMVKNRNLSSFVTTLKYYINEKKKDVGICDIAYCNHADEELLALLKENDLLYKLKGYAGWNTSSNTIGTTLAAMISYHYSKNEEKKNTFLTYRYIEDGVYMCSVRDLVATHYFSEKNYSRQQFVDNLLEEENYLNTLMEKGICTMLPLCKNYFNKFQASFPWKRTFEVDLCLETNYAFNRN